MGATTPRCALFLPAASLSGFPSTLGDRLCVFVLPFAPAPLTEAWVERKAWLCLFPCLRQGEWGGAGRWWLPKDSAAKWKSEVRVPFGPVLHPSCELAHYC